MERLKMILSLLPAILAGIKALEVAIPGTGKGAEKLAALRELLEVTDEATAAIWPTIEKVVAVLVRLLNTTKSW